MWTIFITLFAVAPTLALRVPAPVAAGDALTRRGLVQSAAAAAALVAGAGGASAAEQANRMGGMLEPYVDGPKGFKLYAPSGWNKFDADPGVYDAKWQDIIEPFETVQISSSPVQTATSIDALGTLSEVANKFAKARDSKLLGADERMVDGSLVYLMEMQGEQYHEMLSLAINKGKLYRLSTVAKNTRWNKRQELYKNIMLSFSPKGF
jgi:photosystem II oxygen-evolving enhancer protein 2